MMQTELRKFDDLFERMPNGTFRERAVPLEPKRFLFGGNWMYGSRVNSLPWLWGPLSGSFGDDWRLPSWDAAAEPI